MPHISLQYAREKKEARFKLKIEESCLKTVSGYAGVDKNGCHVVKHHFWRIPEPESRIDIVVKRLNRDPKSIVNRTIDDNQLPERIKFTTFYLEVSYISLPP